MTEQSGRIAELLMQTGHAHHQAFIEVNGEDPEWAKWYADYLYERLPSILGTVFTREQLTEILVALDQKQKSEAPDAKWPAYYADELISRYAAEA